MNITHRRKSKKIQWWKIRQGIQQWFHRNWKTLYRISLALFSIWSIWWWVYWFLFSDTFIVKTVTISIQWPSIKENNEIKSIIKKWITNSSIIYQRIHLWSYLSNMRSSDYPIISWWTINWSWRNDLYINISLKRPDFIYSINSTRRFVVKEKSYWIIGSDNSPTLYIWWSSWNNLSWMFYIIDQQRLEKQIKIITNSIKGYNQITYYPWGGRIKVNLQGALLRIDITSNVYQQIRNVKEYVTRNKLQKWEVIDAWSISNHIFTTFPIQKLWE